MNCNNTQKSIDNYIDNRLGEGEKTAFVDHVCQCPACQKQLDKTLALQSALGNLSADAELPPALRARLDETAQSLPRRKKTAWIPYGAVAAAAVAVLAVFFGLRGPSANAPLPYAAPQDAAALEPLNDGIAGEDNAIYEESQADSGPSALNNSPLMRDADLAKTTAEDAVFALDENQVFTPLPKRPLRWYHFAILGACMAGIVYILVRLLSRRKIQ